MFLSARWENEVMDKKEEKKEEKSRYISTPHCTGLGPDFRSSDLGDKC